MARTKKVDTETTVQETVSEEITEVSAVENSNEAAESQDKPEQKDGQKIYIGVSVPGMKSGTVFTGKIPKVIDVDFVRELCVPINKLSETLKKKAVTGSRVAYCYQQSANSPIKKWQSHSVSCDCHFFYFYIILRKEQSVHCTKDSADRGSGDVGAYADTVGHSAAVLIH